MIRTLKTGEKVTILKQYRQQSNILKSSQIYADLFKVKDSSGKTRIINELEIEKL